VERSILPSGGPVIRISLGGGGRAETARESVDWAFGRRAQGINSPRDLVSKKAGDRISSDEPGWKGIKAG